jgi:hypothetical protein
MMLVLVTMTVTGCASDSEHAGSNHPAPSVSYTVPVSSNNPSTALKTLPKVTLDVPINTKISVTFSEPMDPATFTATTFTLKQGTTAIAGVVSYSGVTAVFAPAYNLTPITEYSATITTGVKDETGHAMSTDYTWSFTTGTSQDNTPPNVSDTSPAANAIDVPTNRNIIISFSETMDPATLTAASFSLKIAGSGTNVPGTVSTVGTSLTFIPATTLAINTAYTATVTTAVKDLSGNAMAANFGFSFTSGSTIDVIQPSVSTTFPARNATSVAHNTNVNATFSEAMNPFTITVVSFTLTSPGVMPFTLNSVAGTVSYSGTTAIFIPKTVLDANTVYTATITSRARDLSGNYTAADYAWDFTTSADADITAPTITETINTNGATNIATNAKAGATFSEAMDPLSITTATFTLKETISGSPVTGTVNYSGVSAVFTPLSPLASGTGYTSTVKGGVTGVKDLAGNPMAADYVVSWRTGTATDTTAPTVTGTVNGIDASHIAINGKEGVTFSEGLDHLTVTNTTFTVKEAVSGTAVAGAVSYSGVTATFIPTKNFTSVTRYTSSIKGGANGIKDLAGNVMAADFVWSWTTGTTTDTVAPTVISTANPDGALNVAVNSKTVVTFSKAMDPLSITNAIFTLKETATGTAVNGTTSYSGCNAIFSPQAPLANATQYTATVKGGASGAKDLASNPLTADYVWHWTTSGTDLLAPTVTLQSPLNLATKVSVTSSAKVTFSEGMNPLTINSATFKVAGVTGLVAYDAINKTAIFTPTTNFANGITYTATVTSATTDLAGNHLTADYVWSFTTETYPPLIALGSASTFGVMARSAIASSGAATKVNGDVALAPGTANGLLPGQVSGTIHINDSASTQAGIDLLAAYTAAKALPAGIAIAAGTDLGGFVNGGAAGVLPPGVYTSGSTMLVTTPLTLDAKGNVNASWVFQVGSSFTTTNNVLLANGAQAKNVYWVSTASATIGAGTVFNGNVIAGVSATSQAGAVINGRILSGATTAGATVLDNTIVNVPAQ